MIELWLGWAGGLAAVITLAALFYGIWLGIRRPAGRTLGPVPRWLQKPVFYLLASFAFFGLCVLLWRPIPLNLPPLIKILALVVGGFLYFAGLGLVLWGRLALGKMYFVSSSLGVELYAEHELVVQGPYAFVRHPIYLGILMIGIGGILMYRTWTFVFVTLIFPGLVVRARKEEEALREEFGDLWEEYTRRVPAWLAKPNRLN